jgi:DNA-binding transcriptional MerR regulator
MLHTEIVDDLPQDDLLAATPEIAARLAGVTVRQINYWREIRLIEPAVVRRISTRNEVRLYDFAGLVELRIVAALRRKLSLQHIREVINRLRASYDRPLTELRFAVQGHHLYFQHPDGTWEGGKRPGQIVLAEVIMLEEVRADVRRTAADHNREPGRVVKRRRVHASKPTFAGTRIPVSAVEAFLHDGASGDDLLAASPQLPAADIAGVRSGRAVAG